jgi:hypothetical protein
VGRSLLLSGGRHLLSRTILDEDFVTHIGPEQDDAIRPNRLYGPPITHVVEGNLKFQIAALRRALGDGRDALMAVAAGVGWLYSAGRSIGMRNPLG